MLNPVWAWVFQGERPGAWALVGGAIILGATTLKGVLDARGQGRVVLPAEVGVVGDAVGADAAAGAGREP